MNRLVVMGLWAMGCVPDDVDVKESGDTGTSGDTGDTQADPAEAIHGDWVSEGDDVAPLLQLFYFTKIDANFSADGTYLVTALDVNGATYDYAGTYTVAVDTEPHTIVLEQATPSVVTSEGIWSVDDAGVLTYEVVQTSPDSGFTAPTPATGFGSTSGPGIEAGVNIQVFRRP
jgi:hypothetical protein